MTYFEDWWKSNLSKGYLHEDESENSLVRFSVEDLRSWCEDAWSYGYESGWKSKSEENSWRDVR